MSNVMRMALAALLAILALPLITPTALSQRTELVVIRVYTSGDLLAEHRVLVDSTPVVAELTPLCSDPRALVALGINESGGTVPLVAEYSGGVVSVAVPSGVRAVSVAYVCLGFLVKEGFVLKIPPQQSPVKLVVERGLVPLKLEPTPVNASYEGDLVLYYPPGTGITIELAIVAGERVKAPAGTQPATPWTTQATQQPPTVTTTATNVGPGKASPAEPRGRAPGLDWLPLALAVLAAAGVLVAVVALRRQSRGSAAALRVLDERDRAIVESVRRRGLATAREIMEDTGIPKTPLYNRLSKLVRMGVLEEVETGRGRGFRLRRGLR